MKADSHPDKKRMKGQTEIKHNILEKYLGTWFDKIKEVEGAVGYIDAFSGWGYYRNGSPGSAIIATETFDERLEAVGGDVDRLVMDFIELNDNNYNELKQNLDYKEPQINDKIKLNPVNTSFEDYVENLNEEVSRTIPLFAFIDPFGFSGVPFEKVKQLINKRYVGVELFINFCSGKMAQYRTVDEHQKAINELLGIEDWNEQIPDSMGKEEAADKFLQIYEDQLREEAGVEYIWPFQMYGEDKKQTAYYLVHATNSFDGHQIMKDIMYNEGAEGQFKYLGPDHYKFEADQADLADFSDGSSDEELVNELADILYEKYSGAGEVTMKKMMKETYEQTPCIKRHYNSAGKILEDKGDAKIIHTGPENNGTKSYGFQPGDKIKMLNQKRLNNFM